VWRSFKEGLRFWFFYLVKYIYYGYCSRYKQFKEPDCYNTCNIPIFKFFMKYIIKTNCSEIRGNNTVNKQKKNKLNIHHNSSPIVFLNCITISSTTVYHLQYVVKSVEFYQSSLELFLKYRHYDMFTH